ncbi:proline-glutamic acid-and leucine-rich 1 [Micractinium conductrix]|uniref:Proline-glutamic acid-and leucine-rich 1 n=1 Tax=Micractinium conductrix TaxID=554055 RepID=A0A2P6VCV7_9CHLO|nr:proline-glutamic acid-and leucine-rich 1 [Micractinium conductrix]|eukprot:PSC71891.1 proline-glutamic acid-and leucine-rich 1 [Micractinium conductrix]
MAGTSGEPPNPTPGQGKRQATSPPEGEGARGKRTAPAAVATAADAALEQRRAELAEVYRAYDALFRASQAAAAAADDPAPSGGANAPPPAPSAEDQEAAFLRLLSAATHGSAGSRRLAARLLPRFARGYPCHSSAAADALIGLATLSLSDRPEQQQAAREQAAYGLAAVAAAAAAASSGTSGQQATIKLVDFCFKQLRHALSHSGSDGPLLNGGTGLRPVNSAGMCSAGGVGVGAGLPPQHLWPCLDFCFTSHFRVVLAACLHALKNPAEPFYAVAREFIRFRLLAAPVAAAAHPAEAAANGDDPPLAAAAAAAAAAAGGPPPAAAAEMDLDRDGAAAGGAASGEQRPLAARVLGALQPKDQGWVRSHVEKWSKEVDPAGSQEAFSLLEQLLRHLPEAGGEQTPPGWLSASVGLPTALPSPSAPTPTPVRGAGGAEQQPAAAAAQQQAQQQRAWSDRGRGRPSRSPPSRSLSSSRSRSRSRDGPALRRGPSRGSGPVSVRGRRRPSDSPPPVRRRTPSPWRTQQRQRSESPWRPQRQRNSSPWRTQQQQDRSDSPGRPQRQRSSSPRRRWSPGAEPRDGQMRRRGSGLLQPSPPPKRGRRGGDGEDGDMATPDGPPPLPRMPPGLPQPVAPPCLAAGCLFFQGLPRNLTERELRTECSKHCKAEWAARPPGLHGTALVWFKSVRDAARCYEAMCDALPWRERGSPLQLTFVGSEGAPGAPQRPQRPPTHVWVAGVGSQADEAEVLRCCREGDVPPPEHLLRVPARRPGLLLVFREPSEAEAALAAIRAGRPRILGPPAPPPLPGRPGLPPGLGGPAAAAAPAVSGSPQPRGARGSPAQRGGRGERGERGEPNGRERESERGGEAAPLPPAEYAGRTLWVGQIPSGLREDSLLQLFRECGELAGYKLLRHTACMFVDFASLAGATEARKRLDGHRVAGGSLRVEFKNENQFWGPGGRPQGPSRDRAAPPPAGRPVQQHPPFRERSAEPQHRPPLAPPPAAAGQPAWQGTVAKSRAPICSAVCEPAGDRSAGGWAAGEPQQWPAILDVAHRADLRHVCSQLFAALRPEERAVLRLTAADAAGRQALTDFAQYLRSKSRAGVVVLPPLPPQAAGQGMLQRTLYLLPPSPEASQRLLGLQVLRSTVTNCERRMFLTRHVSWAALLLATLRGEQQRSAKGDPAAAQQQQLSGVATEALACLAAYFSRVGLMIEVPGVRRDGAAAASKLGALLLQPAGGQQDRAAAAPTSAAAPAALLTTPAGQQALLAALTALPASFRQQHKALEGAVLPLLVRPGAAPSSLLAACAAALPRIAGDATSWSALCQRLLASAHRLADSLLLGLDDAQLSAAARDSTDPSAEPLPLLPVDGGRGGSLGGEAYAAGFRQLAAVLATLQALLAGSYPAPVPVPTAGLLLLVSRLVSVDETAGAGGKAAVAAAASTRYAQLCLRLPDVQAAALGLLRRMLAACGSAATPYFTATACTLAEMLQRCSASDGATTLSAAVRCQLYGAAQQLVEAAGVGAVRPLAAPLLQAATAELYERKRQGGGAAAEEGPARKKRKGRSAAAALDADAAAGAPIDDLGAAVQLRNMAVQAAALAALCALCTAGSPLLAPAQRRQLDDVAAHVAATAAAAAAQLSGEVEGGVGSHLAALQLASYELLLATLLAPAPHRPPHLATALQLFRACSGGAAAAGAALAPFCRHALLACEALLHPRALPPPAPVRRMTAADAAGTEEAPPLGMPRFWSSVDAALLLQQDQVRLAAAQLAAAAAVPGQQQPSVDAEMADAEQQQPQTVTAAAPVQPQQPPLQQRQQPPPPAVQPAAAPSPAPAPADPAASAVPVQPTALSSMASMLAAPAARQPPTAAAPAAATPAAAVPAAALAPAALAPALLAGTAAAAAAAEDSDSEGSLPEIDSGESSGGSDSE